MRNVDSNDGNEGNDSAESNDNNDSTRKFTNVYEGVADLREESGRETRREDTGQNTGHRREDCPAPVKARTRSDQSHSGPECREKGEQEQEQEQAKTETVAETETETADKVVTVEHPYRTKRSVDDRNRY